MRRQMKHPVGRRIVLPLARLEPVAHDRYCTGTTHAVRPLYGLRESEHTMATGHEDLDQVSANESGSSRHKRGRARVACHVVSVEGERAGDHLQHPHSTRTTPVRAQR
jgi:hypothetical protein